MALKMDVVMRDGIIQPFRELYKIAYKRFFVYIGICALNASNVFQETP